MSGRRIGVYVCHCGGNISDYVDVAQVVSAVADESDVVVARRAMFTCSDATQQEIVADITEQRLDGLVVASCSPKLHTFTFREVARRAGLNPYQYTQVNIREQCSWAHTDDREGATRKAISLVRAGIARTRQTEALEPIIVPTVPKALVVGGGISGLRAALGLAGIGLQVFLVEREGSLGGWAGGFGAMYPHGRNGREMVAGLVERVRNCPDVTVFTGAEVVSFAGSFGNYLLGIQVGGESGETIQVEVGSVLVATGFDTYQPEAGEFGYGIPGVVTLPEFKELVDGASGYLTYNGRPVKDIAYIYCVGSRQDPDQVGANAYCSRYCCTAAVHTSLQAGAKGANLRQYHLYRDMRTYGSYELLYTESREKGSTYLKFPDDTPPTVRRDTPDDRLIVSTTDQLAGGEQIELPVDLVVLVTGMVPRRNDGLVRSLKLPVGRDGFFNEIHPKLRPVETVVDGVFICGACQGPKTSAESVASALAAVTQAGTILAKGHAQLDPLVATVDPAACTWCGACLDACPYQATVASWLDGRQTAAVVQASCKGCGGCVTACPENAIDLLGYTDAQVRGMIDGLVGELK